MTTTPKPITPFSSARTPRGILRAATGSHRNLPSPLAGEGLGKSACEKMETGSGPTRRGFTLMELMVTIGIMMILATLTMLAMSGATEAAQIAKTKSLIARLNALVMQKYESYRYRRLPIQMPLGTSPTVAAKIRCDTIRQLMRMEMPDRWTDIADGPLPIGTSYLTTPIPMPSPSSWLGYNSFYANVSSTTNIMNYQGAKCLYLLVSQGLEDPDVMENFNASDYKDFDGTGCKVFVDAWGNPIRFLRWAPGFITNPFQPSGANLTGPFSGVSRIQTGWDRDQTDPTGVYGSPPALPNSNSPTAISSVDAPAVETATNTYALYPLIYSPGPDGWYDIISDCTSPAPNGFTPPAGSSANAATINGLHYSGYNNNPFASVNLKPFLPNGSIGTPSSVDSGQTDNLLDHYDNIHNHLLGTR